MGFDLIGKNINENHTGDYSETILPINIIMNGVSYDSLSDYLEARGLPRNSIKFSCSNRNWHTVWGYVKYANELVSEEHKFVGYEKDFEEGDSNSGHFINEEKAISIFNCCKNGIERNYFNQYLEEECSWTNKSDKEDILGMVERFMDFSKNSGGFFIL